MEISKRSNPTTAKNNHSTTALATLKVLDYIVSNSLVDFNVLKGLEFKIFSTFKVSKIGIFFYGCY
jgi:hypothetical protein